MIDIKDLMLSRGAQTLFENVSLTLHAGQKIGLVGQNGSGKTSLLMLLLGNIEASGGEVRHSAQLSFSHVSQETAPHPFSALSFVLQGHTHYTHLQTAIADAERDGHFEHLAQYHAELADIDGYALPARAASIMHHLGFSEAEQELPVASFSGGWRVRLNLARALFTPADVLLLDEPTNHLDLNTIIWLEQWLQKYQGTLVVISHDRAFLDQVITHVLHIEHKTIKSYTGNYSQFEAVHASQLALQQKMAEKQQAKVEHMMRFVSRFRAKASKAKQAQSRLKMIEKIETVASVQAYTGVEFTFFEPENLANPIMTLRDVDCGYSDGAILQSVDCQIQQGSRIGLLGRNGAGKSTLIKTLTGQLAPLSGEIITNKDLAVGYFAQHQLEFLDGTLSPFAHVKQVAGAMSDAKLRAYLGTMGFTHERVFEPLAHFSGGEKSRLALALIILQKPALLLLDEPTNHLDLETRMALMLALQSYAGSLVLVSHDRYLMQSIVDTLWLVDAGNVQPYPDSLEDYAKWMRQAASDDLKSKAKARKPMHLPQHKVSNRLAQLERKLEKAQQQITAIDQAMCAEHLYEEAHREKYLQLEHQKQALQADIAAWEQEWLQLQA